MTPLKAVKNEVARLLGAEGDQEHNAEYQRVIGETTQIAFLSIKKNYHENSHWVDLGLQVYDPIFGEKVWGHSAPSLRPPALYFYLSGYLSKRRGAYPWVVLDKASAQRCVSEMTESLKSGVFPLLNSIKTMTEVVEARKDPNLTYAGIRLVDWEDAVFRGEATLADKPSPFEPSKNPSSSDYARWMDDPRK